ncbi:MAG: Gfo/Idh/MocA family oxidoreductase, partial [bacterium]|nr:Gfo/Idh/MocA family oxidoreductase [bacterium]
MSSFRSRRNFLTAGPAAVAGVAPLMGKPAKRVLGANDRIQIASIGTGGNGTGMLRRIVQRAEEKNDVRQVAICDVYSRHRERANKSAKLDTKHLYGDYRELCGRDDIDAVIVGTPDHWHALATLASLTSGKDVYCEKPITHLFAEGQLVYKAAAKHKRIFQVGSQQRSDTRMRVAAECVLNGLIGKVKEVKVGLPTGKTTDEEGKIAQEIPAGLDYDMWCGPSRMLPFNKNRLHWNWRWCLDYGGGNLMDWIGHHNDIAHWALGMDKSGPIKVEAKGFRYPMKGIWDNPIDYEVVSTYEPGYTVTMSNRHKMGTGDKQKMGTQWIGEKGWIYVNRGRIEASNRDWIVEKNERGPIKAYHSNHHTRNFTEGIKTRKECICPAETGHRS